MVRWRLLPLALLAMTLDVANAQSERPPFRIEFEYGPLTARHLEVQAPPETGTFLSIEERERNVTATAQLNFEWRIEPRQSFGFFWSPLEARDFEAIPVSETRFGGVSFPAGETTATRFAFEEVAFRYAYAVVHHERFGIDLGGTASIRETTGTFLQESTDLFSEVVDWEVLPLVHARVSVGLSNQLRIVARFDGIYLSSRRHSTNSYIVLRWQPSERWDFNIGYRGLNRKVETGDLLNRFAFDNLIVSFGFAFGG